MLSNKLDNYVDAINQKLENKGWAYVVSKGIDTTSEFNGDGFYIVARQHKQPTKVFAIAGLDIETIGSKSLISFSSGLTLIIKR